jgi:hypothetical protein
LLERAVDVGKNARNLDHLITEVYNNLLYEEEPRAVDGEMPPNVQPVAFTEDKYTSVFLAEQVSIEVATFVFSRGDFVGIPFAVMVGRDCDSTATSVGSWIGALQGETGLPKEWVQQVCDVNMTYINIREMAEKLYEKMRAMGGEL